MILCLLRVIFCLHLLLFVVFFFFFFQAEDGIRDVAVTGVQTCALPICVAVSWRGLPALHGAGLEPSDAEHPEIAAIACFAARFPGCGRCDAGPGPRGQRRDIQPNTRSPAPTAALPRC